MDIDSFEDAMSTCIDSETVMIQDIIIFEDMFSYIEITTFDLLLNCGDVFHEHLALDEWISLWM